MAALRALAARYGALAAMGAAVGTAGAAACEAAADKYFDPDALERGAKALREINNSPNAKRVRWRRWGAHAGSGMCG